jgi:hypothetical protein
MFVRFYIKSKKQDASGISTLRDNQGYLHSEEKDKAEILNAQFKSVYTQEDRTNIQDQTTYRLDTKRTGTRTHPGYHLPIPNIFRAR